MPMFVKRVNSLYRDHTSFQVVCQYDALVSLDNHQLEAMEDDKMKLIFDTNPCHHDYPFAGVQFHSSMLSIIFLRL